MKKTEKLNEFDENLDDFMVEEDYDEEEIMTIHNNLVSQEQFNFLVLTKIYPTHHDTMENNHEH